jgi:hypothetical protein
MWHVSSAGCLYYNDSCLLISGNLTNRKSFIVYSQYLTSAQPKPTAELLKWMEYATSNKVDAFLTKYWRHATAGCN